MTFDWEILQSNILKEKIYLVEIPPGLKLYILPKPDYQKNYAVFSTRFGSIDCCFSINGSNEYIELPDGVAHFLEHKLFEDAEGDVFYRFAQKGASPNAFTSFTQTGYLFSCINNFYENLELLLNFVQNPYFTEETVQKEQGIIGQEISMFEDNPQWRIFFNLLGALYHNHPVQKDIAGTLESIQQITPEILYRCYNTFYHPANMALFIVGGDVDPEKVREQVENNISSRNYEKPVKIKRYYYEEPKTVEKQRVVQSMVVSEPLLSIGFKDESPESLQGRGKLRREILSELLLEIIFSPSEPLYNELYEEGLINEQFDADYILEENYAFTMLGGETHDPELLYVRIMDSIERIKKEGLTTEQIERHRKAKLGDFMRRFNYLEFIANNYLAYRFKGVDFFAYPEILQEISVEEVNTRLQEHLRSERHAVSIIEKRET